MDLTTAFNHLGDVGFQQELNDEFDPIFEFFLQLLDFPSKIVD